MIMCTGFNCFPCMQKMTLSSVLVTPAQERPFYELSPDTYCAEMFSMCLVLGHLSATPFQGLGLGLHNSGWGLNNHFIGSTFVWPHNQRT